MSVQNVNKTNAKFTNDEYLFFRIHFCKIDWIRVILSPEVLKLICNHFKKN